MSGLLSRFYKSASHVHSILSVAYRADHTEAAVVEAAVEAADKIVAAGIPGVAGFCRRSRNWYCTVAAGFCRRSRIYYRSVAGFCRRSLCCYWSSHLTNGPKGQV